jgi:AcrR family transcriptional regulator
MARIIGWIVSSIRADGLSTGAESASYLGAMASADADSQPPGPLFPKLTGGPGRMPPERVARHQKARLEGAMVEAVARYGYAGTTLRELVTLAGVSKSTFYDHFENKQECFLATFDEVVDQVSVRVGEAYRKPGDFRERLLAGLDTFMRLAVDEPAAASLVAVESLMLGAAGVAHRERASQGFELLIQQSFDHSPSKHRVSPLTVRAIVAGIRGVAYRHLRSGRGAELPNLVEELVDWALNYQREESEAVRRAAEAAAAPAPEPPPPPADKKRLPGWGEPPDSRRSRALLSQRERIVRAAAHVVVENGYPGLSIPAISGAAGVSNQTFYEHFDGKLEAFLAAFEIVAGEALAVTAAAGIREGNRIEAIGVGVRALLEQIKRDELFARLAFFELPTAGPVALDRADAMLDTFTAFLSPDTAPSEIRTPPTRTVAEAIPSGVWAAIQHEIHGGRLETLPEMAPELTRVMLVPIAS